MEQPSERVLLRVEYGMARWEEGDRRDPTEQGAFGCRTDQPGDMGTVTMLPAERVGQIGTRQACG